jgi:ADP-ribose pyrophosphatase YjhB (NUDIX family)
MIERVRAILITPAGSMLAIRRDRPGRDRYWVLPGGHVEPEDPDREAALRREIREEIAGEPEIVSLLHVMAEPGERQYFYLARISAWSFTDRTGPEFAEPGRGNYQLDEIPLTEDGFGAIDLQPEPVAALLRDAIRSGRDLFAAPDMRSA